MEGRRMNYEVERNNIIRKYVTGIYHLNWIKLDGNSSREHKKKVCEICIELDSKGLDFLTRPEITLWDYPSHKKFYHPFKTVFPDILTFIKEPFKPVIIEVTDSEQRDHAESKNYPKQFKVIPFDVDDKTNDIKEMIRMKYPDDFINKIICGDCLEVMKDIPDNSIDLVVTSPPYDNLREYDGNYNFDFENTAKELLRIMKIGGVVVWIIGDATINGSETGTSFKQAIFFKEIGFNLHDTMIFHKSSPPLTHNRYEQHFEYMFVFSQGKPNTFNPIKKLKKFKDDRKNTVIRREKDGSPDLGKRSSKIKYKIIGNVWHYPVGGGHCTKDKVAYKHPAIFPEPLAHDHIISWSNENDLILDPFLGSGTTAVVCKKLNRRFIGIEINEKYCKIAEERLKKVPKRLDKFVNNFTVKE